MEDTVEFHASRVARVAAWFVGGAAVVLVLWGVVVQAKDPSPESWPVYAVFVGALFLVARAVGKLSVVADAAALNVHTGRAHYSIPWDRVQGFWLRRRRWYGGVYVLIVPADIVQLPLAQALWPARSNRDQASAMQAALTDYAAGMNAPLINGNLDAVGEQRLHRGPPPTRWKPTE